MKEDGTIGKAYVVINPASGRAEPVLNILNKVFAKHNVAWEVGITHKFGDAKDYVKDATVGDYDVIIGYGGDGTQHEIVEGILGSDKLMGILPGGTGNGFAAGLDIPRRTEKALEMLCTTRNVINVDVAKVSDTFFLSRLYTGIDPEDQTTREMKDKYGVLAYAIGSAKRAKKMTPVMYNITIDGTVLSHKVVKCYVVNSGSTGVGIDIGDFSPTDGILDVFVLDDSMRSLASATERLLRIDTNLSEEYVRHGKEIRIETEIPQSVWADGEYIGKTPIDIKIMKGALKVLADGPKKRVGRPSL